MRLWQDVQDMIYPATSPSVHARRDQRPTSGYPLPEAKHTQHGHTVFVPGRENGFGIHRLELQNDLSRTVMGQTHELKEALHWGLTGECGLGPSLRIVNMSWTEKKAR